MKRIFNHMNRTALAAVVLSGAAFLATQPAQAAMLRTANGQAYWSGDPGPFQPESFWAGGEYKYDPHHYLGYWSTDPFDYTDVVYAPHAGSARCVWRKRVINSNWEFQHPYVRVCRP